MLAHNSHVLTSADGRYKCVQDIEIGTTVFDPLAAKSVEVIDKLQRDLFFQTASEKTKQRIYPVVIDNGDVGRGLPRRSTVVSPGQAIVTLKSNNCNPKLKALEFERASDLADVRSKRNNIQFASVRYFAIFTYDPQVLDVSGLLVRSYSSDIFFQHIIHPDPLVPAAPRRQPPHHPSGTLR